MDPCSEEYEVPPGLEKTHFTARLLRTHPQTDRQ